MEQESLAYRPGNCRGRQNHGFRIRSLPYGTPEILAKPAPSMGGLLTVMASPGLTNPDLRRHVTKTEQHMGSLLQCVCHLGETVCRVSDRPRNSRKSDGRRTSWTDCYELADMNATDYVEITHQ